MQVIVVGFDGSATADAAVTEAHELAGLVGADLHVVHVIDDAALRDGMTSASIYEEMVAGAADSLRALEGRLHGASSGSDGDDDDHRQAKVSTTVLRGSIAAVMLEYARSVEADLIVVGNRRVQGLERLLGSVAVTVLRHAECSVYVAHTT